MPCRSHSVVVNVLAEFCHELPHSVNRETPQNSEESWGVRGVSLPPRSYSSPFSLAPDSASPFSPAFRPRVLACDARQNDTA